MAKIYIYHLAAGSGTGADWTNACVSLTAALAVAAAGDELIFAHDHAFVGGSGTSFTYTFPGTAAAPNKLYCANRAGSVPPVSADLRTTAKESTNGSASITFVSGYFVCDGVTFEAGTSGNVGNIALANNGTASDMKFSNGGLKLANTNTVSNITFGGVSATVNANVRMRNMVLTIGNASQGLLAICNLTLDAGCSIAGTAPTTLFKDPGSSRRAGRVTVRGADLSLVTGTLVAAIAAKQFYFFVGCKLGAGVTPAAAQAAPNDAVVYVVSSDSSTGYYRQDVYHPLATETVETTIVRTGGMTDTATGVAISKKIVTSALALPTRPYRTRLAPYNSVSGANVTITAYGVWGGGAVPNNDDVWTEIAYRGSALTPVVSLASSGVADIVAAGAALTADAASTWGGGTTKFKIPLTLSAPQPAQAGLLDVEACFGKASTTFYIDQKTVQS